MGVGPPPLPWPLTTKENRKGHTRSFRHRRRPVIAAALIIMTAVLMWRRRARSLKQPPATATTTLSERAGTVAARPLRSIDYGAQSLPVVMIRVALDPQLHERFLEEHLYSCPEPELNDIPGLDNRVKPPTFVYEGYYHSLPTGDAVYSLNPNPQIGRDFMKPAAGPFTRAFYEAFRKVNSDIFDRLRQELLAASRRGAGAEEDVCHLLARWIERGRHFSDLSVQIHYGQGNAAKLASGAAWHTDAENSLLHFAVTLRGSRTLHSKRTVETPDASLRRAKSQQFMEILEEQTPGDAYLSSSTLMLHAPQFFDTDYSTRVVAIHARILYASKDINHFRRIRTKESWERLTQVVADTLAAADLQIPSLAQVESHLLLLPGQERGIR